MFDSSKRSTAKVRRQRSGHWLQATSARRLFEPLEPRRLLNGTVVFNELMYHPPDDADATLEWLELHSQMAVDMDLSDWSLGGGVDYRFPKGTIMPGNGYLIVAASPSALQAATGYAGALGPFVGRLANEGETIELLNKDGRVIDSVDYRDDGAWPVGPDGSGATLAKLALGADSSLAASWDASQELGGTPGRANFGGSNSVSIALNEIAGAAEGEFAVELTNFGSTAVSVGQYLLIRSGDPTHPALLPAGVLPAGGYRTYSAAELGGGFRPLAGERLFLYTAGKTAFVDAVLVQSTRQGRLPDGTGPWLFPDVATPSAANHFRLHDEVVINEIMYHHQPTQPADAITAETTPVTLDATWRYDQSGADLGTAWREEGFDDTPWAAGQALFYAGDSVTYSQTVLSDGPAGYWRLDETSGTTAVDASGNGRNATYVGGVTKGAPAASEIDGTSAMFNGSSGYVRLPGTWGGTAVHAMTVEAWVNTAAPITGDFQAIVSSTDLNAFGHYQLHSTGQAGPYTNAGSRFVNPPTPAPAGVWRHVVFVAESGNTRVYVDGAQYGAANAGTFDFINPSNTVHIGNGYGNGRWFKGQIDEVAIYNTALSDAQVLRHYQAGSGQLTASLHTPLTLDPTTYYFRQEFHFDGDPQATALSLVSIVDDGAVYYLNGQEVYRQNMPDGAIHHATLAELPVVNPMLSDPIPLPAGILRRGTNVLAVEVHQAAVDDTDVIFGAELVATETISPAMVYGEATEEWIELFNRSGAAVDLSGWKLGGGIKYDFPAGTTIAPGGYLVVADDAAALAAKYPGAKIVGDFSGQLNDGGDLIVLKDANGNPADEVRYYDGGAWSKWADGFGSSLELRDPNADNSRPEAWAPSDESARSAWYTYTYRGIAQVPAGSQDPTNFNELFLGMLDDAEVLIDDVRVVENPRGAARQLIQNGTFESGTTSKWRLLGNHSHSAVAIDPDNAANRVLRLVSTSTMDHLGNHLETTLKDGATFVTITNGFEYEISFRAKWLHGSPQLRTNLYFNRLPKTTILHTPKLSGTPGAKNSTYAANVGPTYDQLQHAPVVPAAGQAVTVSVRAEDPGGMGAMRLWYSVAGGSFVSVTMVDQGNGRYAGTIPGQAAAAPVQFYVEGRDALGATSMYPAAGPASRAMYRVQDNQARLGTLHNFRIVMTTADANLLHANTNLMSNDLLGATVIYDESEVFYDVGVRLKGSPYSRPTDVFVSYVTYFPPDHRFRGVHDSVEIDRSARGPVGTPQVDEIVIKHVINQAGGIVSLYDDIIRVIAPRSQNTSVALLMLDRYDGAYLDSMFDGGGDLPVHEFDGAYYLTRTTGDLEAPKVVEPGPISYTDIRDWGDDKEVYRFNWPIKNQRAEDDYEHILALNKAFSLSGTALDQAVASTIDVDQWLRHYAVLSLTGVSDTYTHGNPHNLAVYRRPTDGRFISLPYDMDTSFQRPTSSPLWGDASWNLVKIIQRPQNKRLFLGHLQDLINTTYNTAYMSRWTTHYGTLSGGNYGTILSYIGARATFVQNQIATVIPSVPFRITTNGGSDFSVNGSSVTLAGDGWINVRQLRLQGSAEPLGVIWTDDNSWQITLPVDFGANPLRIEAYDYQGNLIGSDNMTVTSTVSARPQRDFLRIGEINYNPHPPTAAELARNPKLGNDDFEYVELVNRGAQPLDLRGARISDAVTFDFTTAAITTLGAGERVLVVRDRAAFEIRYGAGLPIAGQYTEKLSNGGELLKLSDRDGATILAFAYGDAGAWPSRADGLGSSLEMVDVAADFGNPLNWRASAEYGGSPGHAGSGPLPSVVINEVFTRTIAPQKDAIELFNPTATAIDVGGWFLSDSSANYVKYRIPAGTTIPVGGYLVFTEDQFNPNPLDPASGSFALNGAHGDDVWLLQADDRGQLTYFVDHVEFGAAKSNESFGRWPNGTGDLYPMTRATFDQAQGRNSGPRIGPLIISEVQYAVNSPASADLEFVEIYNPTASPVDLTNWRIRGSVEFDFPANTILGSRAALVIAPFALGNTTKLAAFRAAYGIDASVAIVGGFSGNLPDAAGFIRLERPDAAPPDEPAFVPHVLEDQVHYAADWNIVASEGNSLNRRGSKHWGDEAASWTTASPTPGSVRLVAQVADRAIFYNNSAFDGNDPAPNGLDDAAVAIDKSALLPGQTATFANYTSYSRGINGIMIDIADLPPGVVLDAADFQFRTGNDSNPASWTVAPAPTRISTRPRAEGTDRVTLLWPDGLLQNQWLQVTVLANNHTGLLQNDVFYFGNAVAESGDSPMDARVTAADLLLARENPRTFFNPAGIDFAADFNRDGRVNAVDMLLARNHQTSHDTAIRLITVPRGENLAAKSAADYVAEVFRQVNVSSSRRSPAFAEASVKSAKDRRVILWDVSP